jgi:carbon starvation protein
MYVTSTWALARMIKGYVKQLSGTQTPHQTTYVLLGISTLLLVLALAMLVEAIIALSKRDDNRDRPNATVPVLAVGS